MKIEARAWHRSDLAVVGLVLVASLTALVVTPLDPVDADNYLLWLTSYSDGPIKRGLVGSVLTATGIADGRVSVDDLLTLSTTVAWITFLSYLALVVRVWWSQRTTWNADQASTRSSGSFLVSLLAMALLVASPIGVLFYISESYYLDVVNLLVLSVFVHLALFRPRRSIAFAALAICSVLAVLVHENALLSTVPVMMAIYWMLTEQGRRSNDVLVRLVPTYLGCAALVVWLSVGSDRVGGSAVTNAAERLHVSTFGAAEADRVMNRSLLDNVAYTLDKYQSLSGGGSRVLLTALVTGPAIAFLAFSLVRDVRPDTRRWLLVGGLAPLGLALLGDDVYRWCSLSAIALAVAVLTIGTSQPEEDEARPDSTVTTAASERDLTLVALGIVALVAALVLPYPYFHGNGPNPMSEPFLRALSHIEQLVS